MPKKRKMKNTPHKGQQQAEEADNDLETVSNMSVISEDSQMTLDSIDTLASQMRNNDQAPDVAQDVLMEKLCTAVENLSHKSADTRIAALQGLLSTFRQNYLQLANDWNYLDTLIDSLERCLKKGLGQEKSLAAECLAAFSCQCEPELVSGWLEKFSSLLETLYRDASVAAPARASSVSVLAMLSYLALDNDPIALRNTMATMESIFRGSYLKGDGSVPSVNAGTVAVHTAALKAWSLLFTILPTSSMTAVAHEVLPRLSELLFSLDLDLRIGVGETLALIYERIRGEVNGAFRGPRYADLVEQLEGLAREGTKAISKVALKKQKHSFRLVLGSVQQNEPISIKISFGEEDMEICNWSCQCSYEAVCGILTTGMQTHLQDNEFIRDIFDLGSVLPKVGRRQLSKTDRRARRRMFDAQTKSRTQFLNAHRDKRCTVLTGNADA